VRLYLHGGGPLLAPLAARLEGAGAEFVGAARADTILDLSPAPPGEREPWPQEARVLVLCWTGSATMLAARDPHPWRYTGFSALPPLAEQSVIELARPLQAPMAVLDEAAALLAGAGFETAAVPDGPGLIAARTVACLANEAASAVAEGVADGETIDRAMRLGTNYPRGPLEWADVIGPDAVVTLLEALEREHGGERYTPHPLLRRAAAAGLPLAALGKERT